MNTPLVSVIIPNYNHARFLDERLQSVLNQTYQNFEVIILDDKSTDNSVEVINKYKNNPHISHIVINEVNSGSPFKQWNKGFELAKGEWIWIAESDDYCEDNLLGTLIDKASSDNNCVISFCQSVLFKEKEIIRYSPNYLQSGIYSSYDFISLYLSKGTTIVNASSAIFKKNAALSIDNEYTSYKGAGDRLFWTKISEKGSIAYVNEPLNYFRQHDNNSTDRNYKTGINQIEDKSILEYIYNKKFISEQEYANIRHYYISNFVIEWIEDKVVQKKIFNLWAEDDLSRWWDLQLAYKYNKIRKTHPGLYYYFIYLPIYELKKYNIIK